MTAQDRVTVLGGGAWGTALAVTMLAAGHAVTLWARDAATVDAIARQHENPRYLPGIRIDDRLAVTTDIAAARDGAALILLAIPAQSLRQAFAALADTAPSLAAVVVCAKGIEAASGLLPSQIGGLFIDPGRIAVLSGPSFAADVARGLPTAVTVAAREATMAAALAARITAPHFRCYSTDDLVGVELGGALKNVLAIAAGAVTGAGLGASAQAAMVTRGFVELRRVGAAFGARPETLMGLSGFGDLMLSCGSGQSRNFRYGLALGRGDDLAGLPLAEGAATAGIAARIAAERTIDAPIITMTAALLRREISVADAVARLLSRPLKSERA